MEDRYTSKDPRMNRTGMSEQFHPSGPSRSVIEQPQQPMTPSTTCPVECFTAEEVAFFEEQGYAIVRGLADEALRTEMLHVTLDGLGREIGPIEYEADLHYPGAPPTRDSRGGRTARRLLQAQSRHAVFTRWACHPGLTGRLRQLLGPELVMPLAHHNCVMTKQPAFSSDTGWHQDVRYWSFARKELVSVWLALGPERVENGCLRVIPGSHRATFDRGRFDDELFFRPDLAENRELIDRSVPCELDAGDVLLFHARTLHAASRNHTDRPKFSVVFTYRPADNPPLPGTRSGSWPELRLPS
jgi:phytanoyl-CoA hydroxylase